jgi:hypothetical protein
VYRPFFIALRTYSAAIGNSWLRTVIHRHEVASDWQSVSRTRFISEKPGDSQLPCLVHIEAAVDFDLQGVTAQAAVGRGFPC